MEQPKCSKVVATFFDKRKAFDSVVHNVLLQKLLSDFSVVFLLIGIIRSFLSGRDQCVTIGSAKSDFVSVTSGVPQGSVLGPQLFLFYIQSLSQLDFSIFAELFSFADDSILLKPVFCPNDYVDYQADIRAVEDWCSLNSIALNPEKCKVMTFTYGTARNRNVQDLYLCGKRLEDVDEYRYLGVTLQPNPSRWQSHCARVLKKARGVFYAFRNYRNCAPDSVTLTVYRCVIRSILEYCCDVILPSAYYCKQFERLQKLAVRSFLRNYSIDYDYALLKCNLAKLSNRRCALGVVNLLKYLMCSHYVVPGFVAVGTEVQTRRSYRGGRDRDLVLVRNFSTDLNPTPFKTYSQSFKKSFLYRGVHNFNILRHHFDLDSYSFTDLRNILSLLNYDVSGFVHV